MPRSGLTASILIFQSSLKLKAQTAIRQGTYKFHSPTAGDVFQTNTMVTELETNIGGDQRVRTTLFPTLIQIMEPENGMENAREVTVFPAVVVLQQDP